MKNEYSPSFDFSLSGEEEVYLERKLNFLRKLPTFYISSNGQKTWYLLALLNDSDPHQTGCVNRYQLFAVFRANILNKNEISVIIIAKFSENHAIFDQKCSFIHDIE